MSPTRSLIPESAIEDKALMAIETLPEPSIPITTPLRPGLGFLTSTPIIAVATISLLLIIAIAVLAPWLPPHDPLLLAPAPLLKPSTAPFLLGTDRAGRGLPSRHASRRPHA